MAFDIIRGADAFKLKMKISAYVAENITRKDGTLCPVEILNKLNRDQLAREWYEEVTLYEYSNVEELAEDYYDTKAEFLREVAFYIDECIPREYIKHLTGDKSKDTTGFTFPLDSEGNLPYGLNFAFKYNLENARDPKPPLATLPQIRYLQSLAKDADYEFNPKGLTNEMARQCINYFLHDDVVPQPEGFEKHFSPKF